MTSYEPKEGEHICVLSDDDLRNGDLMVGDVKMSDLLSKRNRGCIGGQRIYTILRNNGMSHPRFDQFAEAVRRRENPTEEERQQDLKREKQYEEEHRRQELEEIERNKVIKKNMAFNRLDKLKAGLEES